MGSPMTQHSNSKKVYLLDLDKINSIEDVKVILSLLQIQFYDSHPSFDIAKEYCVLIEETNNETVA